MLRVHRLIDVYSTLWKLNMGYQQSVTYSAHGFRRALYFLMNMHGLYLFYPKCYMLIDWRVLYTVTTMPALEPKCSMPMNWRALLRYVRYAQARYSVSIVTSMLALEPKCSIGLHCAMYVHRLGIPTPPPPKCYLLIDWRVLFVVTGVRGL